MSANPHRSAAQAAHDAQQRLRHQLKAAKRQQAVLKARANFLPFLRFVAPDPTDPDDTDKSAYYVAKHHAATAAIFDRFEAGLEPRIIFCMPPRHGKSEQTSIKLPAYILGRQPRAQVVVATYSDEFAMDFGANVRAVCRSAPYKQLFPSFAFRRGGAAKDRIQTEEGGIAVFVGRGGALTGRGADYLIIDDLFKDHEEARSPAIRDQAWNWFVRVAMSRLMADASGVAIVMTRWHEDDIVGRLTDPTNPYYNEEEAKRWKVIRLPALAEEDDPLGREPGEALWPEMHGKPKFPASRLHAIRNLDAFAFNALYQQHPSVEEGVLFARETFGYWSNDGSGGPGTRVLPTNLRYYCTSDHAVGESKKKHDATVLMPFALDDENNIYLFDPVWGRLSPDKVVEAMLAMARRYKPIVWLAENGHITKSIGPFLRKRMLETDTHINIREFTPTTSKEQRAQGIIARTHMGQLFFPRFKMWVPRAQDEMLKFPNGANDDVVDALSLIGLGLNTIFGAEKPKVEREGPKPGTFAAMKAEARLLQRRNTGGGW